MTVYDKKIKLTYIKYSLITLVISMLFFNNFESFEKGEDNYFHIFLNNTYVGTLGSFEEAEDILMSARRNVASRSDNLFFADLELTCESESVIWGDVDERNDVLTRMEQVVGDSEMTTMNHAYTVKINEYMVNLGDIEEVKALFRTAIDKFDSEDIYEAVLCADSNREFNVLTAVCETSAEVMEAQTLGNVDYSMGGVAPVIDAMGKDKVIGEDSRFSDFVLGLKDMSFAEKIEIAEAYIPNRQITDLSKAIDEVTKEQETASEYEVISGDTLSAIAIKVNIPIDEIIAMNSDRLKSVNTPIHVGDKLVITVPEPELNVKRTEQCYFEEVYDADIIYVDNNNWYTTQTKVLQQPSAGFRKIVANVNFINDKEASREILKEEVVVEAVAKIVERGTKIPPTYIKPISGGVLTSSFGKRKAPTKGASTYHRGVDWSVPKGTSVVASCGGTVAKAGWGNGYGYVIYINHEDGRQTRYGHLSKVLVSAGQTVKQGQQIGLSGNSGVSTGPHLHFEILINGSQVNPLQYLE